jgi:hypothetical protein
MLGLDGSTETSAREYVPLTTDVYVAEEAAAWNNWGAPSQEPRQASQRPADRQQASTPPAGGERVSRPSGVAGPDPQVINDFIGEMEQLPEADVLGWRKAYARAQELGIMAVPIPTGVDGERIQLGAYLMRAGTHAATLAPAPQPEPAAQEEIAGSDISCNAEDGGDAVNVVRPPATVASGR